MLKLIDISVFFIFISLMSLAIPANSETQKLEQFYSKYIDKYIDKCANKEKQLSNSCMPTMAQYVAVNCIRASFIAFYKKGIVSSLIENNVGKKSYKIDQHVNSIFLDVFRRAIGDIEDAERLINRAREAKDKQ